MKKMKRFFALFLAMAMVLGMSMTTFAAEGATLTIENADNATFKKLQVIVADPSSPTGWSFTSAKAADAYTGAFSTTEEGEMPAVVSDQEAIVMLILSTGVSKSALPIAFRDTELKAATANQIGRALSNVKANLASSFVEMTNGEAATSAGIYAVWAEEEGYTYNNMAVYVGFGPVNSGDYPALTSEPVTAKKSPTTTRKTVEDADKVVAIGDVITYTINANVPFIDPNNTNRSFTITDEISGAEYYFPTSQEEMESGSWEGSVAAVEMDEGNGERSVVGSAELFAVNDAGTGFTIDLSALINDANSNADKEITVTYTVKVTETTVKNTAQGHAGGSNFSSDEVNAYTGYITLTKYNEVAEGETPVQLAGAGFEVTDSEGNVLKFVPTSRIEVDEDGTTSAVIVDGDYTYAPDASADEVVPEVVTGVDGTLVVRGLDIGTYHFEEKTAPEGYSINTEGADATLSVSGEAATFIYTTASIADTTLNALPATGGIGTTIFTVGGCAIMIVAAGLFFVSRRRASR